MHVSGLQHQDERAAVSIADGVELCVAAAFGDAGTMRQAPCIIPLAIRKRNGRPEILPPTDPAASNDAAVETHVLRAVANAWSWQRKLEAGSGLKKKPKAASDGSDPVSRPPSKAAEALWKTVCQRTYEIYVVC